MCCNILPLHRAWIGLFEATKGSIRVCKSESKPRESMKQSRRFNTGSLLSICLIFLLVNPEPYSWSNNLNNDKGNYNLDLEICPILHYVSFSVQRAGVYIPTTGLAVTDVQYGHYKFDWNRHMKMVNGNKDSTITLGHWNGGSSHLGKSDRGLHKLEQIKFILEKYKIDILGISEPNLHHDLDPCHYRIEGNDCN